MGAQRSDTREKTIPLLLEYTSEQEERLRQEVLYSPPSRTLQWCIAPLVFLATMVPASVLLVYILQAQNRHSTVATIHHGVTLIPTLSVGVDIMGIGVVLVSLVGLFGVAKGCTRLMNLYFVIVLCFIIIQVGSAISGFMSGSSWIYDALEQSWDRAYQKDKSLIHDLQLEFSCRGFHSAEDRAVHISEDMDMPLPACGQVLLLRFGKRLQRLGLLIFCIRLIQLTGVFLLSILFKHLASTVQSEEGEENEADEESPYFPSEKLLEEESARIPLLSMEDYDLPHYSVHDEPVGDENDDDDDDDDENDDGHRASCTGVVWGARSCHTHFDNHDYSYYGLPEYAEDERETQVYVA